MNKTLIATAVAVLLGFAGTTGSTFAASPNNTGASTATPTTPEQDAKFKDGVKNAGRKIKEKTQAVVAKVKGDKPAEQHATATKTTKHAKARSKSAKVTHAKTPRARATQARADTSARATEVRADQTREQRMNEARLNWERNRKM
jgi:hypothetical protein